MVRGQLDGPMIVFGPGVDLSRSIPMEYSKFNAHCYGFFQHIEGNPVPR